MPSLLYYHHSRPSALGFISSRKFHCTGPLLSNYLSHLDPSPCSPPSCSQPQSHRRAGGKVLEGSKSSATLRVKENNLLLLDSTSQDLLHVCRMQGRRKMNGTSLNGVSLTCKVPSVRSSHSFIMHSAPWLPALGTRDLFSAGFSSGGTRVSFIARKSR